MVQTAQAPFGLKAEDRERLSRHLTRAARGGPGTLASVTVPISPEIDPVALVCAARDPADSWFAVQQPDRGFALATLGVTARIESQGPERFHRASHQWRALAGNAQVDPPEGPAGAGLIAVGGFSFADSGAESQHWRAFAGASLDVPEVALVRAGTEAFLTVTVAAGDDAAESLDRLDERLAMLRPGAELPLWDPDPVGGVHVSGAMPPEHYEEAVARAVALIAEGAIEKVVLAREVHVHSASGYDAGAVFGVLREVFPSCHCVAVGRGEQTLVAATPELLVRRDGLRASTLALAGSTGRSADPAVDRHLGEQLLRSHKNRGEQAIVTSRIERALAPHSVWVTSADEPQLVKIANIQHLATPVRAQLREPIPVVELAGMLHPTPAVGGEPREAAMALIPRL
ncbi:MAG TPA: chorismate-binding protein, partial [Baekduia sp.]|nr:chorismate-binding protein [Baekduia sp.]